MDVARNKTISRRKADLRGRLSRQIDAVTDARRQTCSVELREQVVRLPEIARAEGVLACLSFGSEIDTWRLVEQLRGQGKAIFVPRSSRRDGQLHVHPYPCELRELSFGLRQPVPWAPEVPCEDIGSLVDVVLVLGLAFDRDGYRLGHGKGYFDRFLSGRSVTALGICYPFQLLETIPHDDVDVPMSAVVTSSGIHRPAQQAL